MNVAQLAGELQAQLQVQSKAQHLVLVAAIRAAGGHLSIAADAFATAALEPSPSVQISVVGSTLVLSVADKVTPHS